ncbi:unnamed protein product [Cylicocyclus nassatus]|uniref:Uncharacterized protein n=1 Tax=Cylicocyclus nassatus TaxID=53992 RepID=A0AA36M4C1_CYLNA|nr:unnamed protein product [Cylicocyclus nassatus]
MSTAGRVEAATNHYLPRFARIAKEAKVRQIGYSVDRDPLTGRITFTYNITWTDVDDSLVQKYEILKMNLTRRTPRAMRDEERSGLPRLIKCDGACDRWAPEDYIIQFGLCDHNICYRCYENEESIALTNDGSRGCCNKECVARAKAELALKTPKSSKSAIALGSRAFYVPFPGKKKRRKLEQSHDRRTVPVKQADASSKPWKSKPQAINSEATFFGDYDDARLQEMAETMRLAKV